MANKVDIYIKAHDQASGVLGGIGKQFAGIGSIIGGILGAQIIQDAGRALVQLGKDAIMGASDLAETANKINVLFGEEGQSAINEWADAIGAGLGQSKQQLLDATATFGVFGKSAGLADDDLVDFSSGLTTLASDLASFYNTSPEEAIVAIGAALRGESEPIRKYGVLLNEAVLKQKALELGIISNTSDALTPQQKVLASQAVIYQQTADAQGDFMRTSDGLANSQRILAAQFANIKTELGTALLPVVTQITGAFKDWLMSPAVQIGLQNLQTGLSNAASGVGEFFTQLMSGGGAGDATAIFQPIIDAVASFGPVILENIQTFLAQIAIFWAANGEEIMITVSSVWQILVVTIGGAINIIIGLLSAAMALINGDWSLAWSIMSNTLTAFLQSVLALTGTNLAEFVAMWQNNWNMLVLIVTTVVDNILSYLSGTYDAFRGMGVRMFDGLRDGIASSVQWVIDAVVGGIKKAIAAAESLLKEHSPSQVFAEIGDNMMLGMAQGINRTSGMAAQASANATGAAAISASFTINQAPGQSPAALADAIAAQLGRMANNARNSGRGYQGG